MSASQEPLAGEGSLRAGTLGASSPTAAAVSDGSRRLSRDEFVALAKRVFAEGGTWKDIGAAAGMTHDNARRRGRQLDISSPRNCGKERRWSARSIADAVALANAIGTGRAAAKMRLHPGTLRNAIESGGYRRMWVKS